MLVILSGSSGVGKNTVINALMEKNSNIGTYITCTTRNKREGEIHGKNYYFLTEEEFLKRFEKKDIFEKEKIHEHYYGTSLSEIRRNLETHKALIKDIGVEGAGNIKLYMKQYMPVVTIFLTADETELRRRLLERGEKEIGLRMKRFNYEQLKGKEYDYVIQNDCLEDTVKQIESIIEKNI